MVHLKRVANVTTGAMPTRSDDGRIPVIGANGQIGFTDASNITVPAIVVGRVGSAGAVNIVQPPAWVTDNALLVTPDARVFNFRYAGHVFSTLDLAKDAAQTAQPLITQTMVRERSVPLPNLGQQQAIADYLDTETARIDDFSAAYSELAKAVRDRVDSAIAGVFSGPPVRLKRFATKIGSGSTPRGGAETYVDDGVAFLRSMNVQKGYLDTKDLVRIDATTDREMAGTRLHHGDVLLNITGASIGRSAVATADMIPGNVNQHVCIVRPQLGVPSHLLSAALLTPDVQEQIASVQVGGNRDGLTFDQVGNLLIRWPPNEHIELLDREVQRRREDANHLISRMNCQIDLLAERRQALITTAVTGQLDVPGAAA